MLLTPDFVLQNFFNFKIFISVRPGGVADSIRRVLVLRIRIDDFLIFFEFIPARPHKGPADSIFPVIVHRIRMHFILWKIPDDPGFGSSELALLGFNLNAYYEFSQGLH